MCVVTQASCSSCCGGGCEREQGSAECCTVNVWTAAAAPAGRAAGIQLFLALNRGLVCLWSAAGTSCVYLVESKSNSRQISSWKRIDGPIFWFFSEQDRSWVCSTQQQQQRAAVQYISLGRVGNTAYAGPVLLGRQDNKRASTHITVCRRCSAFLHPWTTQVASDVVSAIILVELAAATEAEHFNFFLQVFFYLLLVCSTGLVKTPRPRRCSCSTSEESL